MGNLDTPNYSPDVEPRRSGEASSRLSDRQQLMDRTEIASGLPVFLEITENNVSKAEMQEIKSLTWTYENGEWTGSKVNGPVPGQTTYHAVFLATGGVRDGDRIKPGVPGALLITKTFPYPPGKEEVGMIVGRIEK